MLRLAAPLVTLLLLICVAAPADARDSLRFSGDASITATPDGADATGTVGLLTRVRGRREISTLDVRVSSIPVGGTGAPDVAVYIVEAGGSPEYLAGRMRITALGGGRLRRNLTAALGDPTLSARRIALAGGTLEVRTRGSGQTVLLSGPLPAQAMESVDISTSTRRVFAPMDDPRPASAVRPPSVDDVSSGILPSGFELDRLHTGRFEIQLDRFADGSTRERLSIVSTALPGQVVLNRSVRTAAYDLRLITPSGGVVTFGRMRLDPRRRSHFSVDTRNAGLPGGLSLASYAGGAIEVRRVTPSNVVVLKANVPDLRDVSDRGLQRHYAHAWGAEELTPIDGSSTSAARIHARLDVFPGRRQQRVRISGVDLPRSHGPYTVRVLRPNAAATELGRLSTDWPHGAGTLQLRRANGPVAPGAHLLALSGLPVEVRNSGSAVVLTGTFPTIE